MDIKHIYEHISTTGLAEYQIKVKGDIQPLKKLLRMYQTIQVTSESADPNYPICMLTIRKTDQKKLFVFISMLLRYEYPIISIICSNIAPTAKKAEIKQNNNGSTSVAITA